MRLPVSNRRPWPRTMVLVALALAGCILIVVAANLVHDRLFHGAALLAASPPAPAGGQAPAASKPVPGKITLPAGKIKAAGIAVETAHMVDLPAEVLVAGTIEANPNRRVDIRPRVPGVVRSVRVAPSQKVKAGDVLAILDSAEVGTARLNVRARQRELTIVRSEAEWKSEIAANVAALLPELRKGTPAAEIEKQFADKSLGTHRAELLGAYAELEIASHEETKQTKLFRDKIIGEHLAFVALHTREAAQARFEASLDQVRYDAAIQKRQADQKVWQAEANVIDAVKRLQILGVNEKTEEALSKSVDISHESTAAEDVTAYPLLAPFDGTIVTMAAVFSQRAEPTDVLFTLADMTTVYAVANIPESDFAVLPALRGGTVRLTAAAYPGRSFEARVLYTGASVDPTTRRVRLAAEMPNADDLFRLGMFVQIRLDSPRTERVLAVPAAALIEVDGKPGVFQPDGDGRTFTLRHVTPGRAAGGFQVITAGLSAGDKVVTTGAFILKSELILQNEPEED